MASVFSHPTIPLALGLALGEKRIPRPLLIAGIVSSIAADFDSFGFAVGIPYASQWGHRGFTHSIFFAVTLAALWTWRNAEFKTDRWIVFAYTFISAISHPLIDAMTDGGLGVALFWPFSDARHFFPWRPIPVSPIGGSFFSPRGLHVIRAELSDIWLPAFLLGSLGYGVRQVLERDREEVRKRIPFFAIFLGVLFLIGSMGLQKGNYAEGKSDTLTWKQLAAAKPDAGKIRFDKAVDALDGHHIKITGYMFPLDGSEDQKHFLFSAYSPSCPYCLPGGPAEMIDVDTSAPVAFTYKPLTLDGRLHLAKKPGDLAEGVYYGLSDVHAASAEPK